MIGRNGMGKTTLCNTIMGLVRATSGEVDLQRRANRQPRPEKIARRGVSYVPQGRRLFPSLTVDEHLTMLAKGTRGKRWTSASRVRPVPASRRTSSQWRGGTVGRRAADARGRPGVAAQRFAGGHGRAVGRARSHDRRHADRRRAPTGGRGSRRARRRAESSRRDAHGRSPAGDGVGPDPGRDDRRRTDRQPRAATALPGRRGRRHAATRRSP